MFSRFLHQGTYIIGLSGGRGTINYSFRVERAATPNGEDAERNDTSASAVPFPVNATMGGTVGGAFADGSRDLQDFFAVNIPSPGTATFNIVSDLAPVRFTVIYSEVRVVRGSQQVTAHNPLQDRFARAVNVEFATAGTYFLRIEARSHAGQHPHWTPYQITMTSR